MSEFHRLIIFYLSTLAFKLLNTLQIYQARVDSVQQKKRPTNILKYMVCVNELKLPAQRPDLHFWDKLKH